MLVARRCAKALQYAVQCPAFQQRILNRVCSCRGSLAALSRYWTVGFLGALANCDTVCSHTAQGERHLFPHVRKSELVGHAGTVEGNISKDFIQWSKLKQRLLRRRLGTHLARVPTKNTQPCLLGKEVARRAKTLCSTKRSAKLSGEPIFASHTLPVTSDILPS